MIAKNLRSEGLQKHGVVARLVLAWCIASLAGCLSERETPSQHVVAESWPPPAEALAAERALSFGVVPQQSATKLARLWQPLLSELGARAGIPLRFHTAPDIPAFEERLAAGKYDIAYMNPYHYTVFNRSLGYRAFARESDKQIRGIIVARGDSSLSRVDELDGSTVAFPAPNAFGATVLVRSYFRQQQWNVAPTYVSSHDSVYRAVVAGIYPAGGGVPRTLDAVAPEIRDQLKVLWTSRPRSPHAVAAHPRVQASQIQALLEAMIALGEDVDGTPLLRALHFNGFEAAHDADWDDIRGLRLDLLDSLVDKR